MLSWISLSKSKYNNNLNIYNSNKIKILSMNSTNLIFKKYPKLTQTKAIRIKKIVKIMNNKPKIMTFSNYCHNYVTNNNKTITKISATWTSTT